MRNKKGFTIIELLSVIIILGILSSLAVISITKYREDVKQKELVNLKSTIASAYDNYRSDVILVGGSPSKKIDFNNVSDDVFDKYFSDFSYSGDRLTKSLLSGSVFSLHVKGDLLRNAKYMSSNRDLVKDGTCLITSKIVDGQIIRGCKDLEPSKEEILCIVLKNDSETLIDDYNGINSKEDLCMFFK